MIRILLLFLILFLTQLLNAQRIGLYSANRGRGSVQIHFLEGDSITYRESGCMGYHELVRGTYVKNKSILEFSLDIPPRSNKCFYYYRTTLSGTSYLKTDSILSRSIGFVRGTSVEDPGMLYFYDSVSRIIDSLKINKRSTVKITLPDSQKVTQVVAKMESSDFSIPYKLDKDSTYWIIISAKVKPKYSYLGGKVSKMSVLFEPRYPAEHEYKVRRIERNSFELLNINSFKPEWRKFYRRKDF